MYSLPEIEHYIHNKLPVTPLDEDLLADVIPPSDEALQALNEQKAERFARNGNRQPRGNKPESHRRRTPRHKGGNYEPNGNQ